MRNNAKELRAQSTLEYAVVIACIVGALLAMQVYIKRGISGKLRSATDDIGQQYDPRNTTTSADGRTTSIDSNVTTKVKTEIETIRAEDSDAKMREPHVSAKPVSLVVRHPDVYAGFAEALAKILSATERPVWAQS